MYITSNTKAGIDIINALISQFMRLSGDITQQWAEVQETQTGIFVIPAPDQSYIDMLQPYKTLVPFNVDETNVIEQEV